MNKMLKNKFLWHSAEKLKQEMFFLPSKVGQVCFVKSSFWYYSLSAILQGSLAKCNEVSCLTNNNKNMEIKY